MRRKWAKLIIAGSLTFGMLPITAMAQTTVSQTATVVQSVNFRESPSTSAAQIRYLKKGESVTVLDKPNAYWLHVKDSTGKTGYVSSSETYIMLHMITPPKYIDLFGSDEDNNDEPTFEETPNATVVSSVSFRTSPSTDASRILYLQKGESVLIVQKVNDYWYRVLDKNGAYGYVSTSAAYLKTGYATPAPIPQPPLPASDAIEKVIAAGMKYIGTPYEYGSSRNDNSTMDCSDLVRQEFMDALQLRLPGDSHSQAAYVEQIGKTTTDWHQFKRGDLVFFMSYKGSSQSAYAGIDKSKQTITHVGLYLGNGQVLHTYSKESGGVRIDNIQGKHWEYRIVFGGSAL